MVKLQNLGILLVSAVSLGACSATWEEDGISNSQVAASVPTEESVAAARVPKTANQIQLFAGSTADQAYTVIQDIKVAVNKTTVFNADPTVAQVEARLKQSAAELNGDAVVNVDISGVKVRAFSWGGRTGKGTVVRY